MFYFLGKYSRIFRDWYFKSFGLYPWGLVRWIKDCPNWSDYEKTRIITNQIIDKNTRSLHPIILTKTGLTKEVFEQFIKLTLK